MDISKPTDKFDFNKEILKKSTLLYIEDDKLIQQETVASLQKLFKEIIVTSDGIEGLDAFKNNRDKIDIILTDINMPNMNGLELTKHIREIDWDIPIVIITAFTDSQMLTKAIKLKVSDYIVKPMLLGTTLKIISKILTDIEQSKLIIQQKKELEQFKEIIDQQNLVSETDPEGNIIYANDIFCEVAGYSKEELIGNKHNIIRHPDTSPKVFKELWDTIKAGKVWKGTLKNRSKDGSSYHVKSTIIPIFDTDGNIIKYMSSRFLTTDEENIKANLKKYILSQKSESIKKEKEIEAKLQAQYNEALKKASNGESETVNKLKTLVKDMESELNRLRNIKDRDNKQIKLLEDELKELKSKFDEMQKAYQTKIEKLNTTTKTAITKLEQEKKKLQPILDKLATAQNNIVTQQEHIERYRKKIEDLNDVIRSLEKKIYDLTNPN